MKPVLGTMVHPQYVANMRLGMNRKFICFVCIIAKKKKKKKLKKIIVILYQY